MDPKQLSAELLAALRGKRSQTAFSKRLGYRSNVASRWESGLAFPTAAQTLKAAERVGVDVRANLRRFFHMPRPWLERQDPCTRTGVVALLSDLRGATPIAALVEQTGCSRFQIARWLHGDTEPRLPELLKLVEVLSLRLLDFVRVFVDPARLPSLAPAWERLCAAREAAFARPWSHAVLRVLELMQYTHSKKHVPGLIARFLGITLEEEQACLALLERAGQVQRKGKRYVVGDASAVDLRGEPDRLRELKGFWLEVARERLLSGSDGTFGFNLFAVSEADLSAIRELHLEFYQQVQHRIAQSTPSQAVALFSTQLLRLA